MTQTPLPLTISQLPDLGSVQGSDRLVLDRIGAAVTAGAFVVGQAYQIISVGNTSFTAIGAESNTIGAYFVATGAGTGTGTAGPINTRNAAVSALAALLGGDPAGTAAAAVAAHVAAADPHPGYTTPQEAAAAAPVQSVALSAPSGWTTSTTSTGGGVTLTLALPTGFSLPSNSSQANWDTAYSMRGQWTGGATGLNAATGRASLELGSAALAASGDFATSAQGVLAATAVQPAALTAGLASKADLTGPGGTVPSSQLPGFVDDVLEFANFVAFPATGEAGKLYISLATNRQYRWSGTVYVEIVDSPGSTDAVPEGSVNFYFTAARAIASALAGFTAGAGAVSESDTILQALQKVVGNIANRAAAGLIGSSGLTMAANRIAGRSAAGTGPVEEFGLFGLAFSGTNLATLADIYIDLSDGSTPLTHSTTVAKKLTQYLRTAMALTDLPVFAVATAPTGAALQFDIKVNGTSIYATLPTIAAGSTNSTASPGTFASAFVTAGQVIATGSVIAYFVTQVGSTVAGAGLLVILPTRRAG